MNIIIPISWLRDYLKTDLAAKTIANYLTASGPSVEKTEKKGDDYIFDIEVTTNRADASSVFGIAREACAILKSNGQKAELIEPKGLETSLEPDVTVTNPLDVSIADPKLCPRFCAIVLRIKIDQSPAIVKNRLTKCGIRPINNIVDITNYVMLETGQPMHAFDFDKIENSKMLLRASKEGEKITTLDGIKRQLPKGSIVISDAKKLIDLCGIMGAENSQITSRTQRVVFFVQSYNPQIIRKTTQSLAFRTDAAARFEKGVDLEFIPQVLSRAVYLAKKFAGAKIISELVDIYPKKQESKTIRLSFAKLNKYLGIEIEPNKVIQILTALGFKCVLEIAQIKATAPSWRATDIEADVDLIEEIARVWGYHKLPSKLPTGEVPQRENNTLTQVIELKKALRYLGLSEAITYSIISKSMLAQTGVAPKDAVELTNPLSEEWQFMRPTIIPSLLDVLGKNQNLESKIKLFEIAKTYDKQKKGLPTQDLKLAFALSDSNFLEIKGLVENLFQILQREAKFTKFNVPSALVDETQASIVKMGDQTIGGIGTLKEPPSEYFKLTTPIAIGELNLSKIYAQAPTTHSYHPIPKFPPVIEDISAIYSVHTPLGDITSEAKKASDLIKKIEIIDVFEDPKLGEEKKSVTFRLTFQKSSSTPTPEEVNDEKTKIIKALETNLRSKIRK